jgi:hypothetical protein
MVDLCSIPGTGRAFWSLRPDWFWVLSNLLSSRYRTSPSHPGWVQKQDVESECSSPEDLCEGACALVLQLRLRGLC